MKRAPNGGRISAIAALLGLGGLGLYWAFADGAAPAPERPSRGSDDSVSRRAPPEPRLRSTQPSANAPNRELEGLARGDEPAVASAVAARSAEHALEEPRHPHPITAQHRRIFEENNRLGALSGAMDQGDFAALRRMNAEYREAYPEDDHDLQEAYDLIADCLEQRSSKAIEAARHFWQTHRASTLRRHVRRHCLEERAGDDAVGKHAPE